jgi:rfaE bifunctional protein nucleotidyltransferase chain/domain
MQTQLKVSEKEQTIIRNNWTVLSESSHQEVDYRNCVCLKPWGYEFLVYESKKIGMWFLRINRGHGTSLHTHFKKDTLIFVLSGTAKITLIDNEVISLPPLSSLHIPRQKFHALSSFSEETYILEIEIFSSELSFSDKNDLLRIDDQYNRKKTGYESSVDLVRENLSDYDHFFLVPSFSKFIHSSHLSVSSTFRAPQSGYCILLSGELYWRGFYYKEGSVITELDIPADTEFPENLFLYIENPYAAEDSKILYSMEHLKCILKQIRQTQPKVILTSGCYDILHVGHIHNLKAAKSLGDVLMVCLSSDEQIAKLKGPTRPVNTYQDRINLFKTLPYIDFIVLYDEQNIEKEETLGQIMKLVKPDIWTKGSDYTVERIADKHPYLNRIVIIDNIKNKSTTNIIKKITTGTENPEVENAANP